MTTRPYVIEDAFAMKWLHSAALHPDASCVAYAVSEYDHERDADVVNLWLADLNSGEHRQLTFGTGSDASPVWSPDGDGLAFVSDRIDGVPQIFVFGAGLDRAHPLTAMPNGVASMAPKIAPPPTLSVPVASSNAASATAATIGPTTETPNAIPSPSVLSACSLVIPKPSAQLLPKTGQWYQPKPRTKLATTATATPT